MKKITVLFIAAVLFILNISTVWASGIELYYDGEYHTYKGSIFSLYVNGEKLNPPLEPIIFNNRALVPLREVFEALGQKVDYNNDTKEITVSGEEQTVKLQIGNNTAYVNGVKKSIPDGVVPKLITKVGVATKTMVPVRFVSESIGLLVEFDDASGAIRISNPEDEKEEQIIISAPTVNKKSSTVTVITIKFSKPMKNTLKSAVTSSGVLYFDVEDGAYEGASQTEINHGAVKKVRLGLHEGYTRVAVDMENYSGYDVEISKDKKTVTITVTAKDGSENTGEEPGKENENNTDETEPDNSAGEAEDNNNIEIPENVTVSTDVESMMNYTPSNGIKYVVIDAGHGGKDPGAKGSLEEKDYYEKDINLNVAKLVRERLEEEGVSVIMTRTGDTYPTLYERSELANESDAAMFVSIHVNSASNAPKANGIEVYYAKSNNNDYYGTTSKALASSVLNAMLDETEALSRGVKVESHAVTRTSLMPAILVELGFISNEEEIKKLIDEEYQAKLADGIVKGILAYLGKITVPDRKELAEMMVSEEIGEEKAKEYINKVWK